jgi:hypothetical protein
VPVRLDDLAGPAATEALLAADRAADLDGAGSQLGELPAQGGPLR